MKYLHHNTVFFAWGLTTVLPFLISNRPLTCPRRNKNTRVKDDKPHLERFNMIQLISTPPFLLPSHSLPSSHSSIPTPPATRVPSWRRPPRRRWTPRRWPRWRRPAWNRSTQPGRPRGTPCSWDETHRWQRGLRPGEGVKRQ